jgi:2-oxoisovalerate dehydrogenase E1 component alpha subunit
MEFLVPQNLPPIATYRVLDREGKMMDQTRPSPDVSEEQAVEWYKNMLTGKFWDSCLDKY